MAAPYPQVVLLGDSLFEQCVEHQEGFSFFAAVQKRCSRRYDVINRGFSGYNTLQVLKILEQVFPKPEAGGPKLKYLIVLLGANDAALPQKVDTQGVPLDEYARNLTRIITHPNITAHNPKILLVTPPPLDEIRTTELDTPTHGQSQRESARSAAYSQAARDVAASVPGTVLIDLQKALMDVAVEKTPGWDGSKGVLGSLDSGERGYLPNLLPDGLHMSGEAYKVFWDLLKEEIDVPEDWSAQFVWPEWRVAEWLKE